MTRVVSALAASFNLGGWRFSVIVFAAGMPRNGSTFSFNVVRELLERGGTNDQAAPRNDT
jgi:hypothetical protein